MNADWKWFLNHLQNAYPTGIHRILPPCSPAEIAALESAHGRPPHELIEMLQHMNGAELFVKSMPLVTFFRASCIHPLTPSQWAQDWYIDKFTAAWRSKGRSQDEWPIAMTNYGVLIVLDTRGITKEWDTGQCTWGDKELTLQDRLEDLLREGDVYLSEAE